MSVLVHQVRISRYGRLLKVFIYDIDEVGRILYQTLKLNVPKDNMIQLEKVFNDVSIPIDIIDDQNMYFDISGIATKYNKRTSEWKNQKAVKEYIKIVGKATNLNETELIQTIGNQVKIHNKLFVNFARFISLEFAYSADKIIYDILVGKKNLIDQKEKEFSESIKQITLSHKYQIEQKDKLIQKVKRKAYANSGDDKFCNVHKFINDHNLNISANELNNILIDENILGQKLINKYTPCPTGEYSKYEDSSIVVNISKMLEICTKRNIKEFEKVASLFDVED